MKARLSSSILLFALATPAFANQNFYVGAFGGGGSPNHINAGQFGTVYIVEASGGPLAVNAFGKLNNKSAAFFGAQLGYQAQHISINSSSQWTLGPAVELEGLSMNKSTFSATLYNYTDRADEHEFVVSYPMYRNVFLANAVFSFNSPRFTVQPYIGFGIGSALVRISGANSVQVNPAEAGINHYNTDPSDTNTTFAGQLKLGLGYNLNKHVSFFAEYRRLYIASSHFELGSTAYATHAPTSSWKIKLGAQKYNLGAIGVRFNL